MGIQWGPIILSLIVIIIVIVLLVYFLKFVGKDAPSIPKPLVDVANKLREKYGTSETNSELMEATDTILFFENHVKDKGKTSTKGLMSNIYPVDGPRGIWKKNWKKFAQEAFEKSGAIQFSDSKTLKKLYGRVRKRMLDFDGIVDDSFLVSKKKSKLLLLGDEEEDSGYSGEDLVNDDNDDDDDDESVDYEMGMNLLNIDLSTKKKFPEPPPKVLMRSSFAPYSQETYEKRADGAPTTLNRLRLDFTDDGHSDKLFPEWYLQDGERNYFGRPIKLLFRVYEMLDEDELSKPVDDLRGPMIMEMKAQTLTFADTIRCVNYHAITFGVKYLCYVWQNTATRAGDETNNDDDEGDEVYDKLLYAGVIRLTSQFPPLIPAYAFKDAFVACYNNPTTFEQKWPKDLFKADYVDRYPSLMPPTMAPAVNVNEPATYGHYFLKKVAWDTKSKQYTYNLEKDGLRAKLTSLTNPTNTRQSFYFCAVLADDLAAYPDRLPDCTEDSEGGWLILYRSKNGDEFSQVYSISNVFREYATKSDLFISLNDKTLSDYETETAASGSNYKLQINKYAVRLKAPDGGSIETPSKSPIPPQTREFFRTDPYMAINVGFRAMQAIWFSDETLTDENETRLLPYSGSYSTDGDLLLGFKCVFEEPENGFVTGGDVCNIEVEIPTDPDLEMTFSYMKRSVLTKIDSQFSQVPVATTVVDNYLEGPNFFLNGSEQIDPHTLVINRSFLTRPIDTTVFEIDKIKPEDVDKYIISIPHASNINYEGGSISVTDVAMGRVYPPDDTDAVIGEEFFFAGANLGSSGSIFVSSWGFRHREKINTDLLRTQSLRVVDHGSGSTVPVIPKAVITSKDFVATCCQSNKKSSDVNGFEFEILNGPYLNQKLMAVTLLNKIVIAYQYGNLVGISSQNTYVKNCNIHTGYLFDPKATPTEITERGLDKDVTLKVVYLGDAAGEFRPVAGTSTITGKLDANKVIDSSKYVDIVKPEDLCFFNIPADPTVVSDSGIPIKMAIILDELNYMFRLTPVDESQEERADAISSFLDKGAFDVPMKISSKFTISFTNVL